VMITSSQCRPRNSASGSWSPYYATRSVQFALQQIRSEAVIFLEGHNEARQLVAGDRVY
jgi:hypothetical protein